MLLAEWQKSTVQMEVRMVAWRERELIRIRPALLWSLDFNGMDEHSKDGDAVKGKRRTFYEVVTEEEPWHETWSTEREDPSSRSLKGTHTEGIIRGSFQLVGGGQKDFCRRPRVACAGERELLSPREQARDGEEVDPKKLLK